MPAMLANAARQAPDPNVSCWRGGTGHGSVVINTCDTIMWLDGLGEGGGALTYIHIHIHIYIYINQGGEVGCLSVFGIN